MKLPGLRLLCPLLFVFCVPAYCYGQNMMVCKDGKSSFSIIVKASPTGLERSAASELQNHLKKTGGVEIPIRSDGDPPATDEIILGRNTRLKDLNLDEDWQKLGRDGYVIRTVGSKLVIAGNTDRGTLNGVYAFLEDVVGVKWLTPETTYFPELKKLALKKLNLRYIPPFGYRHLWNLNARDVSWAARHRLNAFEDHLNIPLSEIISDPRLEDSFLYAGTMVHTIFDLLCLGLTPPERNRPYTIEEAFKQHPEYFSEINGTRKFAGAQLCFTNPDVPKLLAGGAKRMIKNTPKAKIVAVSLMDRPGQCQCASCAEAYRKLGSMSAVYFDTVNKVAEIIGREFPDMLVEALAYHAEQRPPDNIKLGKNVVVKYAPISASFYYALDEGKHNTEGGLISACPPSATQIPKQLKEWTTIADHVWFWYYTCKLPLFHPNPDLRPLSRSFRLLRDAGVDGIFVEDLNWVKEHELNHLRAYLLAELMWNPDYDTRKGTEEFCRLYYGQASKQVLAYLDLLHSEDSWDFQTGDFYCNGWGLAKGSFWTDSPPGPEWNWFNEKPGPSYYKERYIFLDWSSNPPLKKVYFEKAEKIFTDALKQVAGNKELEYRIKVLEMPVYFAALIYLPGDNPFFKEANREFFPFVDKIVSEYPLNKTKMASIVPEDVKKIVKEKVKRESPKPQN